MSHFITEFKSQIQDWMESAIQEFKNPDPNQKTKLRLEKKRIERRKKLVTHYGL